jgi:cell division septation protein DedD
VSDQAAQQSDAARAPLDPMFPQLVRDADTPEQKLIGFIAYGLYEEARREWASDFRDREGRYPGENELRAYERSWTASRLDGIRNAAVQLVAAYAETVTNQIEAEILRRALKGRFWRSVGRWLFSALLYTLAVLGTIVALNRSGIDPIRAIQDLAGFARPPTSVPSQTPPSPAPGPAQAPSPPPATGPAQTPPPSSAPAPSPRAR